MHESEKRRRQQPKQVLQVTLSCPADALQRSERDQLQVAASLPSTAGMDTAQILCRKAGVYSRSSMDFGSWDPPF